MISHINNAGIRGADGRGSMKINGGGYGIKERDTKVYRVEIAYQISWSYPKNIL